LADFRDLTSSTTRNQREEFIVETAIIWVHCYDCNKLRKHQVCHEVKVPATSEKPAKDYQIVQCLGCDTVSFRELVQAPDRVENLYPSRMIRDAENYTASRAPTHVVGVYNATLGAFNAGAGNPSSFILCSAGVRTLLELICDDLKVGRQLDDLKEKIAGLAANGHITGDQMRYLQDARGQGNDAVHRGEIPPQDLLASQLDAVEYAIHGLYVLPELFNKGERLEGVVVEVRGDGIVVRVGKSTPTLILTAELGESGSATFFALKPGQKLWAKVVSDRGEPLRLSKKDADADIKREEDARVRQEEAERVRRAALRRLKPGNLLYGVVTRLEPLGIVVKITQDGVELEGWVAGAEVESRNPHPRDRMEVVVTAVRPADSVLELSEKQVHRERAYQQAEDSFQLRTVLVGQVIEPTLDGKVRVRVGRDCHGFVHRSQLGEADPGNLDDWRNSRIPVRVTNEPVRFMPLQLSHRAALNRINALDAFKIADRLTGKALKFVSEGLLLSIDGTEGLIRKSDLSFGRIQSGDEVRVEVAEVDPRRGLLVLKHLPADGASATPADEFDDVTGDDGMGDSESEQGYAAPSADVPDPAEADRGEIASIPNGIPVSGIDFPAPNNHRPID